MVSLLRMFCVAVVLGFVMPSLAVADTARERAGKHVMDGDQLKVQAEEANSDGNDAEAERLFEAAADEYRAAYDLVPHPLMLYNLGQVSRLAGKQKAALEFYEEFLRSKPTGEAADFARSYVRILERSLARDDDDDDDDDNGDDDDDGDDDDETDIAAASSTKGDPGKAMRYGGIGLAAAGLISVAIGVKFGLDAQNISDCLSNYPASCDSDFPADQWTDEALKLEKEGESASNKMLVFTGVGAAAVIAGGIVFFMADSQDEKPASEDGLVLLPSVRAHSLGVGLSGRF